MRPSAFRARMTPRATAAAVSPRAKRPATVHVREADLEAQWKPFLQLRHAGFAWDGSDYQRPTRSARADLDGLMTYMEPLIKLLSLAPTGFPSLSSLRAAFISLDVKYNLFGTDDRLRMKAASMSADVWRVMCRDTYLLARNGCRDASMKRLVDSISLAPQHRESDSGSVGGDAVEDL